MGDDREHRNQFDERERSVSEKKREGKRSDHHRWWRHLRHSAQSPVTAMKKKERSEKQGYWTHQTRQRRQRHSPRFWLNSVRLFAFEVGSETLSINFMFMSWGSPGFQKQAPIKEVRSAGKYYEPCGVTISTEPVSDWVEEGRPLERLTVAALNIAKKGCSKFTQEEIDNLESWLARYRASNDQSVLGAPAVGHDKRSKAQMPDKMALSESKEEQILGIDKAKVGMDENSIEVVSGFAEVVDVDRDKRSPNPNEGVEESENGGEEESDDGGAVDTEEGEAKVEGEGPPEEVLEKLPTPFLSGRKVKDKDYATVKENDEEGGSGIRDPNPNFLLGENGDIQQRESVLKRSDKSPQRSVDDNTASKGQVTTRVQKFPQSWVNVVASNGTPRPIPGGQRLNHRSSEVSNLEFLEPETLGVIDIENHLINEHPWDTCLVG
ncbi:hypothetical protein U1Q18_017855, partial [Sarracenia purpurea var. burkii]